MAAKAIRIPSPGLESVQALRALAATTVIAVHLPYLRWGSFGVDIFFVVSGFIICYIASINPDDFLLKRIFRIVPLYWVGTLGVVALALLLPQALSSTSFRAGYLAKSLFFIPYRRGDGAMKPILFLGWTLNYEIFFYLVFAGALSWKAKKAIGITIGVLSAAVVLGWKFRPTTAILEFYSTPIVLEFAFGSLAFLFWRRYRSALRSVPVLAALGLSVLSYAALWLMDVQILNTHGSVLRSVPPVVLRGVPAVLLFMGFLSLEGKIRFPKWILAIGDASYSLYLFHPYIIELVDKKISLRQATPLTVIVSVLTVVFCFLCAGCSYRLVERPSNEFLRNAFLKRKTKPRDAQWTPTLAVKTPATIL
jgi:peptidoglycan/LPS O-acetylase OafA/YrhL